MDEAMAERLVTAVETIAAKAKREMDDDEARKRSTEEENRNYWEVEYQANKLHRELVDMLEKIAKPKKAIEKAAIKYIARGLFHWPHEYSYRKAAGWDFSSEKKIAVEAIRDGTWVFQDVGNGRYKAVLKSMIRRAKLADSH